MLHQLLSAAGDVAGEAAALVFVVVVAGVGALWVLADPELRRRRKVARRMARDDRSFARRQAVR